MMNPKAMQWVIYLGMVIAIVQMLGGCDNRPAEQAAPERPAAERPVGTIPPVQQPAKKQRDAERLRNELYSDWPKPNLRPNAEGTNGQP
jgi:hypothetical protein